MKSIGLLFFYLVLSNNIFGQEALGYYKLNNENTKVEWKGSKIGSYHTGTVQLQSGIIEHKNNMPIKADITIFMGSIKCTDLDAESALDLENHLKNKDFFETSKFETSNLIVNSFKKLKSKKGYLAEGVLTIKNISHPIKFNVINPQNSKKATIKLVFDRTKYDIKFHSGITGIAKDKLIKDEIELNININLEEQ